MAPNNAGKPLVNGTKDQKSEVNVVFGAMTIGKEGIVIPISCIHDGVGTDFPYRR